jgi:hypothetical protein
LASRTAWAGTATTEIFDVADANSLPGGWVGYAQVTADQNTITTLVDLTGLSQAVTLGSNRRIRIHAEVHVANGSGSGNRSQLYIREGSTTLQRAQWGHETTGTEGPAACSVILTPSSGSHTYKLSLEALDASTTNLKAAADIPAFIYIEDVGPAS